MARKRAVSAETLEQIDSLEAELTALEVKRRELAAGGLPTVQAQIDHLSTLVQIHSHASTLARLRGDVSTSLKQIDAISKLSNEIHKLQRDLTLDRLNELKERADKQGEAASILAAYHKG